MSRIGICNPGDRKTSGFRYMGHIMDYIIQIQYRFGLVFFMKYSHVKSARL